MTSANFELIEKAVSSIENRLRSTVLLEDLSEELCLSKFHLHRLFKALTGRTLITYVRGRKLSCSLMELLDTSLNVIDIAQEYAFRYEQSYERAFKHQFGMTPSEFRRCRCALPIVQRFDTSSIRNCEQGILIEPQFIMKPTFVVGGMRTYIVHRENDERLTAKSYAHEFYNDYRGQIPNEVNEDVYYGLVLRSDDPYKGNDYMPCVEIAAPVPLPAPLEVFSLPTHMYAVFRYIGFHSPLELSIRNLMEIYNYIEWDWQQRTKHSVDKEYHFERIDGQKCSSTYCEADIYVPIMQ